MASLKEFEALRPDMAAVFKELLNIPIAYLATVRNDGSPRVHPVCPIIADGRIFVAMNESSPKRFDLTPEGRYAMHTANPEPKDGRGDDEFYFTGRAWRVGDDARKMIADAAGHTVHGSDWLFEFDIDYAMSAIWENWAQPDTYAVRKRWSAGGGVRDDDGAGQTSTERR